MFRSLSIFFVIALFFVGVAHAEKKQENIFASVFLKGDKIGHIHLTTVTNEKGEIEELKANASVSFLGMEVYGFTQNLTEKWLNGELQEMRGKTDDNGTPHEISLDRDNTGYKATYNMKAIDLPITAFPTSPWHYDITKNKLLFNIVDFELLAVQIQSEPDTVEIEGNSIETVKFTFTGDWKAILWFDKSNKFLKGDYDISGRQITVVVDQ
ncbi:DUF6134 family protein [Sneathiella marina]|uniref:DUF6134 family protein n=1 Tax=Sneathiella marina TaxID=2950108 RepID=A0ABY4W622_9PROT|nr:DUF6134 family protein [Sneathiella marina]USG62630.1 DUF6134 family protein [Sneathiella marina]